MNCTECKELLVAYIEGLLDESQKQTVAEHLKGCLTCQTEVKELTGLHDRLVKNGTALAQSDLENNVMNQIVREQNVKLKATTRAGTALKIRRTIMKSSITKMAVAAAVIIVALVGVSQFFGGTVTFADVVEPILNAKTVILDVIIGTDETNPFMHEIVVDSLIRRTMSNIPNMTMIIDLDNERMLVLDSEEKTAAYVDMQGEVRDRHQNYVKFLRQIIRQVQGDQIEKIGEQVIDGQKAIGFVGRGLNEAVTIWADAKTGHPIRIEAQIGQEFAFIMKNFEFDVPIDDSPVSMDVPAGYTEEEATADLTDVNEQDFVESLRIFAEVIGDGVFPEAVGTETTMKQMPVLVQKAQQKGISEEEIGQLGTQLGRGMIFHQILETQGQWHYAGAGVKLGDADTAIFWYQPKGSETYRVINGDLSVKDVAPENLPK